MFGFWTYFRDRNNKFRHVRHINYKIDVLMGNKICLFKKQNITKSSFQLLGQWVLRYLDYILSVEMSVVGLLIEKQDRKKGLPQGSILGWWVSSWSWLWWQFHGCTFLLKLIKPYISNMCSLLFVNYTSNKAVLIFFPFQRLMNLEILKTDCHFDYYIGTSPGVKTAWIYLISSSVTH